MIVVKEMKKSYGFKRVLEGVSFTADRGQITCLIGVNGTGKSTIMKAIMGLTPFQGEVLIDGAPLTPAAYERIVYIPDTFTMPPNLTVGGCMAFMADFYRNWNADRAAEMLDFFKLNRRDRVSSLSKGNTSKLNLLLGLAIDADYVLMDEPFSGIDMFSREQIASVFTSHLIENRGVIITTHEIGDIEHLIDRAVLLDNGIVRMQFNCEEMRGTEGKSVTDVMREVYRG